MLKIHTKSAEYLIQLAKKRNAHLLSFKSWPDQCIVWLIVSNTRIVRLIHFTIGTHDIDFVQRASHTINVYCSKVECSRVCIVEVKSSIRRKNNHQTNCDALKRTRIKWTKERKKEKNGASSKKEWSKMKNNEQISTLCPR